MSVANPLWGAPRIHGELLKLGIDVGQTSVAKYMVRRRVPPSQGWKTFLRNHREKMRDNRDRKSRNREFSARKGRRRLRNYFDGQLLFFGQAADRVCEHLRQPPERMQLPLKKRSPGLGASSCKPPSLAIGRAARGAQPRRRPDYRPNTRRIFVERLSRKRTPLMRSSKQSLPDIPQSEPHYEAPSSLYPPAPQAS